MAIDISKRLKETNSYMDEVYTFPLKEFRELILDVSQHRFCVMLNKVGGTSNEETLEQWEVNLEAPDWRNVIAIKRLFKLAKVVMAEKASKRELGQVEKVERSLTSSIFGGRCGD